MSNNKDELELDSLLDELIKNDDVDDVESLLDDLLEDDPSEEEIDDLLDDLLTENTENIESNEKTSLLDDFDALSIEESSEENSSTTSILDDLDFLNEKEVSPLETPPSKKKSKKGLFVVLCILVLAITSAGGYFIWDKYLNFKSFDFLGAITFVINGSNDHGYYEIDKLSLNYPHDEAVNTLLHEIEIKIEPNEHLKNDDSVKVTAVLTQEQESFLKSKKVKLKHLEETLTVMLLEDVTDYDFFKYVTISFENGQAVSSIEASFTDANDDQVDLLRQVKVKPISLEGVKNGDSISVSLDISNDLDKKLKESGINIKETSKEYEVSGLSFVPVSLSDIPNLETLKSDTTKRIEGDYKLNVQSYSNFKVVSTCYASEPTNKVNFTDYDNGYSYEKGSLMFIYEFDQGSGSSKSVMYDAYGYTGLINVNGEIDSSVMKTMSPFQSNATLKSITDEMTQNNFKCE